MRKSPLKPGTKRLRRYKRAAPRKRTSSEYLRIYGGPERAKAMRLRPCDNCGAVPSEDFQNEIHHTENEGMGRKGSWRVCVTLCASCHRAYHWLGSAAEFLRVTGTDLRAIARRLSVEIPA